jgi:hypothetical protein
MLVLEKGEDVTDENQFDAYVDAWLEDGEICLEIMDENDKSTLVCIAPEFLLGLIQKAFREKATENPLCPDCEATEIQVAENIKLPIISKGKTVGDSKLMIV